MDIRGLTVGEVAGIINAAVVVATLTFPLLLVLFVIGLLRETNTAATWSVLGRLLNDSLWPLILGTDTVARRNVSKRVVASSLLATLGMIVLAIVSPITPLGLSTHVGSTSPKPVIFSYVPDTSPMGQATISHADYTNNRLCGAMLLLNCPGSRAGYDTTRNSTGWYANSSTLDAYMSSTIAPNITEVFTSGTNGDENTVSSVFDIAWRSFIVYGNATKPAANEKQWIDHGRSRAQGSFQYSQSFILNNRYEAIEGLIVDTISGAIGFRNHTMPPSSETGFEWSETLLWIEPETICVDMNLTVDYSIPSPAREQKEDERYEASEAKKDLRHAEFEAKKDKRHEESMTVSRSILESVQQTWSIQ
ncbi:hypothetical protein H2201_008934 [Coniosporium apollinis]|uniref:Carboxylic ester hydrolase n=1 Tax=Coniosporium apollinis TaxID=61459 RepID=A0ABQ9NGW7_9PEZI|nr:hypothetical protein H2201_008934 [Coniosporium apollinis]